MKKHWYDYLWIFSTVYLTLGLFNILFAWLGLICFITPLLIAIIGGSKAYCHRYCGRGQLFILLGGRLGLSRKKAPPKWVRSVGFRYGFLAFFMTMFLLMIYNTYLVFAGASLQEAVTLLWVFKLPWTWTNTSWVTPWAAQFAFGFYGVMLTSTVLGLLTMVLYRPRSWCVYCPMGTMTQGICQIKHGSAKKGEDKTMEEKAKQIAELLKLLSNENRLLILCALIEQPLQVGRLAEKVPNITQSALSQHLALLKAYGILDYTKTGQSITYSLADPRVAEVMSVLKQYYCEPKEETE